MNQFTSEQKWGIGIVFLLLLFFAMGNTQESPDDPEEDDELIGVASFDHAFYGTGRETKDVRKDASRLADICLETAMDIEYDARKQGKLTSGSKVIEMRNNLRDYCEKGGSFTHLYPDLGSALEEFLSKRLGSDDNKLDEASRKNWVKAYRDLGKALAKTAQSYEPPKRRRAEVE